MMGSSRRARGFTLLEVVVAMAILAGSLTALLITLGRSVQAAQHARLMTTATFLCRQHLVELEDKFITDGFTDDSLTVEQKGDFEEPYKKRYRWVHLIEKITLPSVDQIQSAATKALQDRQQVAAQQQVGAAAPAAGSSNSAINPSAFSGMLGPVKDMLEQGIRKVTVRVLWEEPGRPEQQVEVATFYTDMRRIPLVTQ